MLVEPGPDTRRAGASVDHALLEDLNRSEQGVVEREARVDGAEVLLERPGVERSVDRGDDHRVLVGEDPEDGALGDARGVGDLAGGHHLAVRDQQRQRGGHDRRAPLIRRHGSGAPGRARQSSWPWAHSI